MAKVKSHNIHARGKVTSSEKRSRVKQVKALRNARGKVHKVNAIIFSGSGKKPESQMTPIEKMERLNVGITKNQLEALKARTELDYDKLANLLLVTRATLINKPSSEKFNSALSERILRLADIYSYGYDVFEDEEKFNQRIT